jgi:hypothetical protein
MPVEAQHVEAEPVVEAEPQEAAKSVKPVVTSNEVASTQTNAQTTAKGTQAKSEEAVTANKIELNKFIPRNDNTVQVEGGGAWVIPAINA